MDLTKLVEALETGGPWALVAILCFAVGFLARAYVAARDSNDEASRKVQDQLMSALMDFTENQAKATATDEKVAGGLSEVARRLENVERALQQAAN